MTQGRLKCHVDIVKSSLKFEIGDQAFLRVAFIKGAIRFRKQGKLSRRYVGPYEILNKVNDLALPPTLVNVHNVFYVSMLRKYISNPSHVIEEEPIELGKNSTYVEWAI